MAAAAVESPRRRGRRRPADWSSPRRLHAAPHSRLSGRRRRPSGARPRDRLPPPRPSDARSRAVGPDDEVWVLLSGGATSLLAAPVDRHHLRGADQPLRSPAWVRPRHHRDEPDPEALFPLGRRPPGAGAGSARVRASIVSDVIGDDLASIGSGPCVPDPATAARRQALLEQPDLWPRCSRVGGSNRLLATAGKRRRRQSPETRPSRA